MLFVFKRTKMSDNILEIKNITKSYGKKEVLKGVNLSIKKGEKIALIGVNGSGKSTLLEIICGVKRQSGGEIQVPFGKGEIGYMPQTFSLFQDLTVGENLGYLAVLYHLDKGVVQSVLEKCFLTQKKDMLAKDLSGGYKQLLSLASSIIFNPQLLVLDEPTSAMDPLFRESFQKILSEFMKDGGSVLLTTHYMEEIDFCDKVAILSDGKIVYADYVNKTFGSNKFKNASELIFKYTKGDSYEKQDSK